MSLTLWHPGGFEDFAPKNTDRTWLCARLTRALKVVESCSKTQKTRQVFWSALEKNFCLGGWDFL